ncbi:MAG: DNA repair protein RadA [Deltaproteobacteria bacterium]|nr:DNA repair protein RadA [Deltaproteobacteria bacterium]
MAKQKTIYTCQSCGHASYRWLGRCPDCGSWNSFLEERVFDRKEKGGPHTLQTDALPQAISTLDMAEEDRVRTNIGEFDRVLGGGMVPGSTVLIGGDPGIGKSTLLLQAMGSLAAGGHKVLYVSGEESLRQIRLRGERLGALSENLLVLAETSLEKTHDALKKTKPGVLVIDSVQTLASAAFESSPGSLSQVKEVAASLITYAKKTDVPVFLVGHVTKDGNIAGPKALEHMVDTVLYFEGERGHQFRILRAVKNRFGSAMEIGIFEMKESGLAEVLNPSEIFLAARPVDASGSAVTSSLEGTRTVLVEVQSLVCRTIFGIPRRTVVGVDYNRVMLLAAVLEKKAGITLANHDIFIKVAGGIRLDEPAVDLGVVSSLASNFLDKAVDPKTVIFGEVGLAGEVRGVNQAEPRVKEAAKLGFKRCIMPKDNLKGLKVKGGIEIIGVTTIKEAMAYLF